MPWKEIYNEAKKEISNLQHQFPDECLFGNELGHSLESSIANIYNIFDNKESYPTIEDKAAMLLYSLITSHSFSDGNKRIASALFKWFLEKNEYDISSIDDVLLESLTKVIASRSEMKDSMLNE
jgi:death-on-curing family protein